MSVFHHDNIYLTWLNLKADNLSTLNYPYYGESIGINNSIQLSGVESKAPASGQGRSSRSHHRAHLPGFRLVVLADGCPQAFRSSYISSARTFPSLQRREVSALNVLNLPRLPSDVLAPSSQGISHFHPCQWPMVKEGQGVTTGNRCEGRQNMTQVCFLNPPVLATCTPCPHIPSVYIHEALHLLRLLRAGGQSTSPQ